MTINSKKFIGGVSGPKELIETLYIGGLHKPSVQIAHWLGIENFIGSLIKKYSYDFPDENKELEKEKRSINKYNIAGLGKFHSKLATIAGNLKPKSKVLKIDTYLGKSTISLSQGCELSNSYLTCVETYYGHPNNYSIKE